MATPKKTPITENLCYCGCGKSPKRKTSRYMPGHDARFHGRIVKILDGRLTLEDLKGEIETYALPLYREKLAGVR